MAYLEEMYDLGGGEEDKSDVMSQISESADFLCDSEADKDGLKNFLENFKRALKDKDEIHENYWRNGKAYSSS